MTVTTKNSVEGQPVRDYRAIVTGEAILGTNFFLMVSASGKLVKL